MIAQPQRDVKGERAARGREPPRPEASRTPEPPAGAAGRGGAGENPRSAPGRSATVRSGGSEAEPERTRKP